MKITKIETTISRELFPGLLLCRIETESGLVGYGESSYIPHAIASVIHDWASPRLLGASALDIEGLHSHHV